MSCKICVVGPKGTCKTTISNFLAGQSEKLAPDRYDPTAGIFLLSVNITAYVNKQAIISSYSLYMSKKIYFFGFGF
jgi:hypothetical protein